MTPEGIEQLKRHEGLRLKAYKCPAGVWTIGYGHTGGVKEYQTITQAEADRLLSADIGRAEQDARRLVPGFNDLSPRRQDALVNMAFNLGYLRLSKFVQSLNYIRTGRFVQAAGNLEKTAWYRQVGHRGPEVVAMIREG